MKKEHLFEIANQITFKQEIGINTDVRTAGNRFGIPQTHIDKFIDCLLQWEVEGRKVRTKYQILMETGAPQAENFLWTILGNKVWNNNQI